LQARLANYTQDRLANLQQQVPLTNNNNQGGYAQIGYDVEPPHPNGQQIVPSSQRPVPPQPQNVIPPQQQQQQQQDVNMAFTQGEGFADPNDPRVGVGNQQFHTVPIRYDAAQIIEEFGSERRYKVFSKALDELISEAIGEYPRFNNGNLERFSQEMSMNPNITKEQNIQLREKYGIELLGDAQKVINDLQNIKTKISQVKALSAREIKLARKLLIDELLNKQNQGINKVLLRAQLLDYMNKPSNQ